MHDAENIEYLSKFEIRPIYQSSNFPGDQLEYTMMGEEAVTKAFKVHPKQGTVTVNGKLESYSRFINFTKNFGLIYDFIRFLWKDQ